MVTTMLSAMQHVMDHPDSLFVDAVPNCIACHKDINQEDKDKTWQIAIPIVELGGMVFPMRNIKQGQLIRPPLFSFYVHKKCIGVFKTEVEEFIKEQYGFILNSLTAGKEGN